MKSEFIKLEEIYIPNKRRNALEEEKINEIAESILEDGQKVPIQVRRDAKKGFILVNGAHRIEAVKLLGEETVEAFIVREGNYSL
ncbi:MAG: chromosome partitioning protein ParB [Alphaproteobacteria bacterium]|nr:chromosome partitioning protein ParB [Alphaproteobacteria bacterium]